MPRAVGVDIGSGNLKICELEATAKRIRVLRYVEAEFDRGANPIEEAEEAAEVLRGLFQENKIKRDAVAGAISGQDCVVRSIKVPFTGDEQVRKVIRFEAESHLHSCALEDVVVDYHKTGEFANKSEVMIFAARKEAIRHRLETFEDAAIDPLRLGLDALALYNAVRATSLLDPDQLQVILDIGSTKTNLVITDGRDLKMVRSLRIGTESVSEGIPAGEPSTPEAADEPSTGAQGDNPGDWVVVEDVEVALADKGPDADRPAGSSPPETGEVETGEVETGEVETGEVETGEVETGEVETGEVETGEVETGEVETGEVETGEVETGEVETASPGSSASETIEATPTPIEHREFPFLQRIVVEISRSLVPIRTGRDSGRILITGGGSLIEGLPAALEDRLQMPVEWIDLREAVSHDLGDDEIDSLSTFGTVALGLALGQLDHDPIGVDFRKEEFRYQRAFDQVKVVLCCCVSLVAILLLVVLAFLLERKQDARYPWQVLVSSGRGLAETAVGDIGDGAYDVEAFDRVMAAVSRQRREYEKRFGKGGDFPQLRSAFDVWNDLSRVIVQEGDALRGLKIESMDIRQDKIVLRGTVPDPSQIDVLKNSLTRYSDEYSRINSGSLQAREGAHEFKSFTIDLPERKGSSS